MTINLLDSRTEGLSVADQITMLERLQTRLRTWAAFALILIFLIITIALWGYAAWWGLMKLIGLFA